MKALNTLLSCVSSLPELFPTLEELLFPLMQKMISTEGQDIFEEASRGRCEEACEKMEVHGRAL